MIADTRNNAIRKVSGGTIATVAGTGTSGYAGDNGPATSALLDAPYGAAADAAGNIYIADSWNGMLRKVSGGIIATIAGGGSLYFGDNGSATEAGLGAPNGVAADTSGNVYIADTLNNAIRKVSNGVITTVAGNGISGYSGDNGPAASANLNSPYSVAVDTSGNLYIADTVNNVIREVANGVIATIAGNGKQGNAGDGGPATSASLNAPQGVAVDATGDVFIADTGNSVIRKIVNGTISTVAGTGLTGYIGDGGPATGAALNLPTGVAVDLGGNLYIADSGNEAIREISGGVISTLAGNGTAGYLGDNGPANGAEFRTPSGVAVDAAGNVYVADHGNSAVRKISGGIITTIGGTGTQGYTGDGGPATSALFGQPAGVAVGIGGNVYVADVYDFVVRVLTPGVLSAQMASLTGSGGNGSVQVNDPAGVAWTASSNDAWITITSGASGTGGGTVTFAVAANTTGAARSGSVTIAGQVFTVEQASSSAAGLSLAGSMPQVASAGGWDTSLTLVNLGTAPGEALLNLYANDGSPLTLPFTFPQQPSLGTVLSSSLDENLDAGATLVLDTTGPASQALVGASQLLTSGNMSGFAIFKYVPSGQEAVVPLETRNAGSYVLAFDNTGQLATGLAITNLATSAADIGVVLRNDTGVQIGTGSISLAAEGHASFMLTDAQQGFPITAGIRGTVEFDTPQGGQIAVLGLRANGPAITTLPVLANVGTAGGTMPHVASGGGWQTTFTLVNTGTSAANATLNFYDNNGSPLTLPLEFPQTGAVATEASVSQSIAAGATLLITQGLNSADLLSGSAQLVTNGQVSGFAVFQNAGQEAVVPLESGSASSYLLAFDNTNNLETGVAISNDSGQIADVPVTLRDNSGAMLATRTISLLANGHSSQLLTTYFPAAANIRGTVEFDTPSGGQNQCARHSRHACRSLHDHPCDDAVSA